MRLLIKKYLILWIGLCWLDCHLDLPGQIMIFPNIHFLSTIFMMEMEKLMIDKQHSIIFRKDSCPFLST